MRGNFFCFCTIKCILHITQKDSKVLMASLGDTQEVAQDDFVHSGPIAVMHEESRTGQRVRVDCDRTVPVASANPRLEWPCRAVYPLLKKESGILLSLPPVRESKFRRGSSLCLRVMPEEGLNSQVTGGTLEAQLSRHVGGKHVFCIISLCKEHSTIKS